MKLIFRYIVAIIMIPIGVLFGVLGWIQNRRRKTRYDRDYKEIVAKMHPDEGTQTENKGQPG